ncbi:MAG: MATE family efflux transporter [Candidatus Kapaibacterium sp.]
MKENSKNASYRHGILALKNQFNYLTKSVAEAISGREQDYTSLPLGRAIFLLSLPMILEMTMESVFAVADIFFVSRLGAEAVATVGITESMMTIVYAIGFGLSIAASATVARRIGEKDKRAASNAAWQAIIVSLMPSAIISLVGIFFAPELLAAMGASDMIVNEYSGYAAIMLGSNFVVMLLFVINAIFRGAGDAAISMKVLWLANLLNIGLDPLLIFGWGPVPAMGVEGAAIATAIGRGVGVVLQLVILFRGSSRIQIFISELKADLEIMGRIVKLSLGAVLQNIIATMSWVILVRIVAEFGSEAVAGYTICIRILLFALLPTAGLNNAAATLVGQNLGAGRPDRAEQSVWMIARLDIIVMGLLGLGLFLGAERWVSFFIDNPRVIDIGSMLVRVISVGFISYGVGMVMINSINGAGDTITPTRVNLLCFWAIEIPLAYALAIWLGMEEIGVGLSIVIAETILTLIAVGIFKKGKWKLSKV